MQPLHPPLPEYMGVVDIVAMWPSQRAMAHDIARELGLPAFSRDRVRRWRDRGRIPPEFQLAVLMAARRRGYPVTAADMVQAHSLPLREV